MNWACFVYLLETTGDKRWRRELDEIFNVMTENHPIPENLVFGAGKQMNEMTRFWYDVQRVRIDSNIHTTFDDGALPCT